MAASRFLHRPRRIRLDEVPDGVVVLDRAHRIRAANGRFAAMAGREAAALVGTAAPWPHDALQGTEVALQLPRADGEVLDVEATVVDGRRGERVAIVRDVTRRRRAEELSGALRRVATAVAAGTAPERVFALVAREACRALHVESASVVRYEALQGVFVGQAGIELPTGPFALDGGQACAVTARTGRPARVADHRQVDGAIPAQLAAAGLLSAVAVPVRAGDVLWGALVVRARAADALGRDVEDRLARLADLMGLAIANADAQDALRAQASADPLTGLRNHRVFQERLRSELERATREGRPLSLAIFDVDGFRSLNEAQGHVAGDEVLRLVGGVLAGEAPPGATAGRISGDELALLLPGCDAAAAAAIAERARHWVAHVSGGRGLAVTVSAGVCDRVHARDGRELQRLAHGALYWAKANGRDAVVRYDPAVVHVLSADEQVRSLERDRALTGLHALVRALDAKDPFTHRHSERVAALAGDIAHELGWAPARAKRLHQAALLHDVGKIGLPDALLFKPGAFDAAEQAIVRQHAALGARIVAGVLDSEQAAWIRGHHERPDGTGYPDRLCGDGIPDGARVLALADAYDAMTGTRHYRDPLEPDAALAECRRQAGGQFDPAAVAALERLLAPRAERVAS